MTPWASICLSKMWPSNIITYTPRSSGRSLTGGNACITLSTRAGTVSHRDSKRSTTQSGPGQAVTRGSPTLRGWPGRLPAALPSTCSPPTPRPACAAAALQPPELGHPRCPGSFAARGLREEARGPSAPLPGLGGSHARPQTDGPRAAGQVPAPRRPGPAAPSPGPTERGPRPPHRGRRRRPRERRPPRPRWRRRWNWGAGLRGRAPSSSPISPTPSIS